MTSSLVPAKTGYSRVFLIRGRARPDHTSDYQSNMAAGAVAQSFGDIEKIEVPSPVEWGKFIEVGQIRGQEERATVTLNGRYAADLRSELLSLAREGCPVDVQINFGACSDPSDANVYTKKLVLEDALLSSFSTEDLGALGSDENAAVNESAELSARLLYELLPITFATRDEASVLEPYVDAVWCGTPTCGDCLVEDSGCDFFVAVTEGDGITPGTDVAVVYSLDGGATLSPADITLTADATGVACYNNYVEVVAGVESSWILQDDLDGTTGPNPTFTAGNGFANAVAAISAWENSKGAWACAAAGFVYKSTNPTVAATGFDTGVGQDLADISSISEDSALAVGAAGAVVLTSGGDVWTAITGGINQPATALTACEMITDRTWIVGDDQGDVYYTVNAGASWALIGLPDPSAVPIESIDFSGDTVGYLSKGTNVLMTNDGGNSWTFAPNTEGQSIPTNGGIAVVAACRYQADKFIAAGGTIAGADGLLLLGSS